jgi:hypothetical protein
LVQSTSYLVVEDYNHGREITLDQVNLALFSTDIVKEQTTYETAINSEQKEDQIKWENAINKELKEMDKRGVWEIIDEKYIPINCRCIKNKWKFKVKRNGIFKQDFWYVATVKSQELISVKFLHPF